MKFEIVLSPSTKKIVSKALKVAQDYVDFMIERNRCIISVNSRNVVFAGFIDLGYAVPDYKLRLSTQVLKQLYVGYDFVRIEDLPESGLCVLTFFKKCNDERPFVVRTRKSLTQTVYYDEILRSAIEDELFFGTELRLSKYLSTLNDLQKHIHGLSFKDLFVNNGVVYVESTSLKFFCRLPDDFNVFLPVRILNVLGKDAYSSLKCDEMNGHILLKAPQYIVGWRKSRITDLGEYESYELLKPGFVCSADLRTLSTFIDSIKLADNREQICTFNFERMEVEIEELNVGTYVIPFHIDACDGDASVLGTVQVPIKPLRAILHK